MAVKKLIMKNLEDLKRQVESLGLEEKQAYNGMASNEAEERRIAAEAEERLAAQAEEQKIAAEKRLSSKLKSLSWNWKQEGFPNLRMMSN